MRVASSRGTGLDALIDEIADSIVDKGALLRDVNKYLGMDIKSLPQFTADGQVAFYDIGNILLGKSALVKFIEKCREQTK